ncbi:hypothetical protein BDY24DRAFT_66603 [Mrakia frigida]|uniref:uncharacterized protein n=1 Tax=Mrakia frigida TaxID=29902 RepID=UPI003FCC1873
MRQAGGGRILVQVTPSRQPSLISRRTFFSISSKQTKPPYGPTDELTKSSTSSLSSCRDGPPHLSPTPNSSSSSLSSSSPPNQHPREIAPSSSSLPAPLDGLSPSSLLPSGWTSVQGTVLSPEIARIFANVNHKLSASYEEEKSDDLDPAKVLSHWGTEDEALPGRVTEDALVHHQRTPVDDEPSSSIYGGLPALTKSMEVKSTQESRRESDDGSRAYLEFLSKSTLEDPENPRLLTSGPDPDKELALSRKELEQAEKRDLVMEKMLETWEPFASNSTSSNIMEDSTKEDLPTWAKPLRSTNFLPTTSSTSSSLVKPRSANKQLVYPPDSFTSLPPLPWSSPSPTDLVVPPRPSSFLNSFKPQDDAPWQEDATNAEYRRLSTNLDDLSNLHPSLINQRSLLLLLDEFLPLAYFKGERRQETLEKLFACGLVPSRALMQTMLRAVARWRGDLVGSRMETEAIIDQMTQAGVQESKEEKIETLALLERVYIQNGNIVAANDVKTQLYSLTPTPPRPTDLLLSRIKPTPKSVVTLSQILPLISEVTASKQIVPDDALDILARIVPLDVWSYQGFVDAAGFVEEETRRTLTPSAWAIFMDRAFSPRPERGPRGWLPRSKREARVDLDVILRVFHRIPTPSPQSVAAGIKLISRVAVHPAPLEGRISTIEEVYKTVIDQLTGSSSPNPTSLDSNLALPSSSTFVASPSPFTSLLTPSNTQDLETLFRTTIVSLLDSDVPFTLPVASVLSQVHSDQRRLLGYSTWHDRTLSPLRDPPYPMQPQHIASIYSILVLAFPEEMKPVELYWSFLTRAGRSIRSEPLTTTKAVLSIVQARLDSGEKAFAGKTMWELVETLKTELWRGEAVRKRVGGERKPESLDRDPRRGLLAVETVALEMDPRSLSAEFWNSLVEATSFSMDAQSAAWKVLVEVYPESVGEDAIILRLRTTAESRNPSELFAVWKWVQQLSLPPSPLIWNAWFEALLKIEDYDRFVAEIVNKSPEPASDDLLRWALDRLHDIPSSLPLPTTLSSISIEPKAIPRAAELLPATLSTPVLATSRLVELLGTLKERFGERWERVEEERKVEMSKKDVQVEDQLVSLPFENVSAASSPPVAESSSSSGYKPNLSRADRKSIILKCLETRGVSPSHPAHSSLFDTLLLLSSFSLKTGSYFDLRAMFHSSSSPTTHPPPISIPLFTELINVHLDILNVNKETSYVPPPVIPPPRIEDLGGYGMKSSESFPFGKRRRKTGEEARDTKDLLDFKYKEVKW